jgi:hypothetical protein
MNASGEARMNSWFYHVYLERLSERLSHEMGSWLGKRDSEWIGTARLKIQPSIYPDAAVIGKRPRRLKKFKAAGGKNLDANGPCVNLNDPVIEQFTRLIKTPRSTDSPVFSDLKLNLEKWLDDHKKGPATYDHAALDAFFASGMKEGGWLHLDAIFRHMCGTTISEIIEATHVIHDPLDPGLHGDICYTHSLELSSFEFTNFSDHSPRRAMASSLDLLLPMVIEDVRLKGVEANSAKPRGNLPEDYAHEKKVERALPAVVYIDRNGEPVLSVEVQRPSAVCQEFTVSWEKVFIQINDKSILQSLLKVVPASAVSKLKGRFLEDGLGL